MPKSKDAEQMQEHRFQGKGVGLKHGQKPISVLLPEDLDTYVRSKPNRSEWLRQVIAEAMQKEQAEQVSRHQQD